jgi:glutamate synthase domain-containing protein 2/glutamate synthase domain-containing protein 1
MPESLGSDGPEPPQAVERDSCGLGFIASRRGEPSRAIVLYGLEALANLSHRGGIGADGESGDGAGLLTDIPRRLLAEELESRGVIVDPTRLAVAMVYLPPAPGPQRQATAAIEQQCRDSALRLLGWRKVPVDPTVLGPLARATMPTIRQLLVEVGDEDPDLIERRLYLIRRRLESWAQRRRIELAIASWSCRTVVYKGMVLADRLGQLFPDLRDSRYESRIALFHLRFSTNTEPRWHLAQPLRLLAHNGEINTIEGNANWMRARERELSSEVWGEGIGELFPVLEPGGSDSLWLDNALELLIRSGRHPAHALLMAIPAAPDPTRSPAEQAFASYHAALLEPWDGPAALVLTDGRRAIAGLDRNGLRPLRVWQTEQLIVVGSEAGIVAVAPGEINRRDRLGPGQVLSVDLTTGEVRSSDEIHRRWAELRPWGEWLDEHLVDLPAARFALDGATGNDRLERHQRRFGYSTEVLERMLDPMALEGVLPVASMGDDTPAAVLSTTPQLLYRYFKQRFAQVTNPPIDPLRERRAFSLEMMVGPWGSLLEQRPEAARQIRCASPVLAPNQLQWLLDGAPFPAITLEASFPAGGGPLALAAALGELAERAETAIDGGAVLLVLSDEIDGMERAPIPMVLAVSSLHHYLIRRRKRMQVGLIAHSGEPREDHHIACLVGFGASLVHPWLAYRVAAERALQRGIDPLPAQQRLHRCLETGLIKVMAKQGVCAASSYQGAQLFEALGLDADLVENHFPGTPNRIGGVGLERIVADANTRHLAAVAAEQLPDRGLFRFRREGEHHALSPMVVKALHKAVRTAEPAAYAAYLAELERAPPCTLRDLLTFEGSAAPLPLDQVEGVDAVHARLCSAAMSHGAISRETHEAIAVAMNRIGGKSNSGEGGELEERLGRYEASPEGFLSAWRPQPGDRATSAIKQVASARFGVSAAYLRSAREIEIKISQGSKPGEGGQIPGHKVTADIAALRRATPGQALVSPPPHHDIYSIEDLAQLIDDLRHVHPEAAIGVKLVSSVGVGTIAAGVAKAGADVILIAGDSGGTGASPLSSIRHAGLPWELGLTETHAVLSASGLRSRVRLRVDGGLRCGRDVVLAALLGAEEFGFGTVPLIAVGCVMARQCHLDTCPVGIATQRPELRAKFPGTPDHLVTFFAFLAEEVRGLLAGLGVQSLGDLVGRRDLLRARADSGETGRSLLELIGPNPMVVDRSTRRRPTIPARASTSRPGNTSARRF